MRTSCNSLRLFLSLSASALLAAPALALSPSAAELTPVVTASAAEVGALPDSPGATLSLANTSASEASSSSAAAIPAAEGSFEPGSHKPIEPAARTDKYIEPGQSAPALTAGDKVRMGFHDAISPFAVIGWISSAAYAQALNNAPNYGQGGGPFAQRFGAAAARAFTEDTLSDSFFAPILHEDPRYYRMGPGNNFFKRTGYAITRTLVTRSDSGRTVPNIALLAGNAAGSVLTNAYYPDRNRNVKDTVETFGGSIGGSALGFFISEFLSDTLQVVHLKKSE